MKKNSITAFEAPALLDLHGSLTRLDLYERLSGTASATSIEPGLSASIADSVMDYVGSQNGWKPIRRDSRSPIADGLDAHARSYSATDDEGPFQAVFQHVPSYLHSAMWAKAGVPPLAMVVQANWIMMVTEAARLGYVVLADKKVVVYWVARDDSMIQSLRDAAQDMASRIERRDPPPIDSKPAEKSVTETAEPQIDCDVLVSRYLACEAVRAETTNVQDLAEHAYQAASAALKRNLAPGTAHEFEGVRISHNAKTGRLMKEKIDGLYF